MMVRIWISWLVVDGKCIACDDEARKDDVLADMVKCVGEIS